MRAHRWFAAALLAVSGLPARADNGFQPLLKGDDPRQFELVGIGPETLKISDGVVEVSGKPYGYLATRDRYRNYILKFDWMYDRPSGLDDDARFPGNSGLLIHVQEPRVVWPRCVQVQLMNTDAGHTFAFGGARFRNDPDADARRSMAQKRAIKPVGQWNEMEVLCQNGAIRCTINGVEVDRGTGADPDSGFIAWQSEGSPIRFRNLRIKPLD
jgi:hypothetical protein